MFASIADRFSWIGGTTSMACKAAKTGDLKTLEWCIRPANVNVVGYLGYAPLHLAARHGQEEAVTFLLSDILSANVNVLDSDNMTPLHHASAKLYKFTLRKYSFSLVGKLKSPIF